MAILPADEIPGRRREDDPALRTLEEDVAAAVRRLDDVLRTLERSEEDTLEVALRADKPMAVITFSPNVSVPVAVPYLSVPPNWLHPPVPCVQSAVNPMNGVLAGTDG